MVKSAQSDEAALPSCVTGRESVLSSASSLS
jgi:hypothetical protein